jgi:hypothetical protein
MVRGVDRKKLAEWQRPLSRYERTGLTAVEFCRDNVFDYAHK